jgi:hypothetical protein
VGGAGWEKKERKNEDREEWEKSVHEERIPL